MGQTSKCSPFLQSRKYSDDYFAASAFFNDITYVKPKVPSLYTALSSGELATNPAIYGSNTNPFILNHNEVIEIVLNNLDPGKHPFHLRKNT